MGVIGLSNIEVLRTCMIHDRELEITEGMMDDFIRNFAENVYGTELQVNLDHNRGGEAAGWIKHLYKKVENGMTTLMATVEWTPLGMDKIKNKLYRFTSSELALEHPHHATGVLVNNVLIGVALTNIPAVKGMAPVELSEKVQAFINKKSYMDKLKAKFAELNAKDKLSFAEYQEFKNMAYLHSGVETAKMLSELEGKAEEAPVEEPVADEEAAPGASEVPAEVPAEVPVEDVPAAEEPKPEEAAPVAEEPKAEEPAEAPATESLSEKAKLVQLSEENKALKEQIALVSLTEEVATDLCLSEKRKTGFNGSKETINRVAKFMVKLSQPQRAEFKAILAEVKTVDLTTRGAAPKPTAKVELNDSNVADLAQKLMESGTAKDITEAQKMATAQLSEAK